MSFRRPSFLTSGLFLLLAAGVAADASREAVAQAADLSVRPYVRPHAATGTARVAATTNTRADITGTINAHGPAAEAPQTVPVSHARSARAHFNEARAAMERILLLRTATPKTDAAALDVAMKDLFYDLTVVERAAQTRSDAIKKATALAQDWYQAGATIIRPPAGGATELPLPMRIRSKADAVAAALDRVIEQAVANGPRPQRAAAKRRAHPAPRPVATGMSPTNPAVVPE